MPDFEYFGFKPLVVLFGDLSLWENLVPSLFDPSAGDFVGDGSGNQ